MVRFVLTSICADLAGALLLLFGGISYTLGGVIFTMQRWTLKRDDMQAWSNIAR